MACLVHLYLDWKLSGDDEFLTTLWPAARRALEFCWIPGGWDADRDGVMEGVQHNTMDVEYYGPNPQMGSWYLAALRACAEMAESQGDAEFAGYCRQLFTSGSQWLDAELFNGEYYRHEVRGVQRSRTSIAAGLRHRSMGAADSTEPDLQLADGCLVDQLVGQYAAALVGLGSAARCRSRGDHACVRCTGATSSAASPTTSTTCAASCSGTKPAVLMCTYDADKRPSPAVPVLL